MDITTLEELEETLIAIADAKQEIRDYYRDIRRCLNRLESETEFVLNTLADLYQSGVIR